jgi:hypothetical protein
LRRDILLADDDLVALIEFAATVFFDRNVLDRCSMRWKYPKQSRPVQLRPSIKLSQRLVSDGAEHFLIAIIDHDEPNGAAVEIVGNGQIARV